MVEYYHIARGKFRRDRLFEPVLSDPSLSMQEKEAVIVQFSSLVSEPEDVTTTLREKFLNSGTRPNEVAKPGRYHKQRCCFYISSDIAGTISEAAYYMFFYNGRHVWSAERDYIIVRLEIDAEAVDLCEHYSKSDLICTHHPLSGVVETAAETNAWPLVKAPSARHEKAHTFALYNWTLIQSIAICDRVQMSYDWMRPTIRGIAESGTAFEATVVSRIFDLAADSGYQ